MPNKAFGSEMLCLTGVKTAFPEGQGDNAAVEIVLDQGRCHVAPGGSRRMLWGGGEVDGGLQPGQDIDGGEFPPFGGGIQGQIQFQGGAVSGREEQL